MDILMNWWLVFSFIGFTWAAAVDNKIHFYHPSMSPNINSEFPDGQTQPSRTLRMIGTNGKLWSEVTTMSPSHMETYNKLAKSFVYVFPNMPPVATGHQDKNNVNNLVNAVTESFNSMTTESGDNQKETSKNTENLITSPSMADENNKGNEMDIVTESIKTMTTMADDNKKVTNMLENVSEAINSISSKETNQNENQMTTQMSDVDVIAPDQHNIVETSQQTFSEFTNNSSGYQTKPTTMSTTEIMLTSLPEAREVRSELNQEIMMSHPEETTSMIVPENEKNQSDPPEMSSLTGTNILIAEQNETSHIESTQTQNKIQTTEPPKMLTTPITIKTEVSSSVPVEQISNTPSTNMPRTFSTNDDGSSSTNTVIADMIRTIKASKAANAQPTTALNNAITSTAIPVLVTNINEPTKSSSADMTMSSTMILNHNVSNQMDLSELSNNNITTSIHLNEVEPVYKTGQIIPTTTATEMLSTSKYEQQVQQIVETTSNSSIDVELTVTDSYILEITSNSQTIDKNIISPINEMMMADEEQTNAKPVTNLMSSSAKQTQEHPLAEVLPSIILTTSTMPKDPVAMTSMSSIMNRPPKHPNNNENDSIMAMDDPDADAVLNTAKSVTTMTTKTSNANKPSKSSATSVTMGTRLSIIFAVVLCLGAWKMM